MNTVNVIGLGYIGLPTATLLALGGFRVYGVDVQPAIVDTINKGVIHLKEPGLGRVVGMAVNAGKLSAHLSPCVADYHIIAVPTPLGEDNKADLSYMVAATEALLPILHPRNVVIVESTIPPGTTCDIVAPIIETTGLKLGKDLFLAHCPERVLPGRILEELVENSRVVGGYDAISAKKAAELYKTFVKGEIVLTDATTAELAKLVENTYRDLNIAFANELVKITRVFGVNASEVIAVANKHPRVSILQPGPGVGGHCLAVDPYFIVEKAESEAQLIAAARKVNNSMPNHVVEDLQAILGNLRRKTIAVFGLTYKANVSDTREAPSATIIELLEAAGANVRCHDPHVISYSRTLFSAQEAARGADCIVFAVDHQEFKQLDRDILSALIPKGIIYDAKNVVGSFDESRLHRLGDYRRQRVMKKESRAGA